MDKRFIQANKEAKLSLILTLIYLTAWLVSAYLLGNTSGLFGLPLWFEVSCLFLPIGFILLCWLVVKYKFINMLLDAPTKNK
ncbi:DUF997 family protein [Utexia brackfieldae]|uniref:YhdT family protein n=1 Tax=Utexia brackfieldae TaxID=3074108 RepID=UPI00370D4652